MVIYQVMQNDLIGIEQVAQIENDLQPHDAWSQQTIISLLENPIYHLAIVTQSKGSEVIGYCLWKVLFEQAELLRIGTKTQFQRQGVAQALLDWLMNQLGNQQLEVDNLLLEVRKDNLPAIALYKKLGFECIDERLDYYRFMDDNHEVKTVNALIMQKIL